MTILSGYNDTPPIDDGSQTEANTVKWSTIKEKLTDPLKNWIDSPDFDGNASVKIDVDADSYWDYSTDDQAKLYLGGILVATFAVAGNKKPVHPAFIAIPVAQTNVTGDGTAFSLLWAGTERADQGGNFASSTFTAPVTGLYQMNLTVDCSGIDGNVDEIILDLIVAGTSNHTYSSSWNRTNELDTRKTIGFHGLVDMTITDTCTTKLTITGGGKTVDIVVAGTIWSGYLVA